MKTQKKDLLITQIGKDQFQLFLRKRWLIFFERWIPLTYQEAENSNEIIYEFKSMDEAKEFIEIIAE